MQGIYIDLSSTNSKDREESWQFTFEDQFCTDIFAAAARFSLGVTHVSSHGQQATIDIKTNTDALQNILRLAVELNEKISKHVRSLKSRQ